jgi:hypothetical protein
VGDKTRERNTILDPWGNEYGYDYDPEVEGAWEVYGDILYSKGPDDAMELDASKGLFNDANTVNDDNVYAR